MQFCKAFGEIKVSTKNKLSIFTKTLTQRKMKNFAARDSKEREKVYHVKSNVQVVRALHTQYPMADFAFHLSDVD